MAYSVQAVANAFIKIARQNKREITNIQLQKEVFFAHGWYLGIEHEPLVDETAEAWRYGPVFPSLYRDLRCYGSGAVTKALDTYDAIPEDSDIFDFLRAVYAKYSQYTPGELIDLTHRDGTPWAQCRESYNSDIPNRVIEQYYGKMVDPQ